MQIDEALAFSRILLNACQEAKRVTELIPPLPQGLTPRHLKVVDAIQQLSSGGQAVKVSDISNLLQVTRPGITRLINELESFAIVTKEADAQDKRIVRLHLTSVGLQMYEYYIVQFHSWLAQQLPNLSPEEARVTAASIHKLYTVLTTTAFTLEGKPPVLTQKEAQHE